MPRVYTQGGAGHSILEFASGAKRWHYGSMVSVFRKKFPDLCRKDAREKIHWVVVALGQDGLLIQGKLTLAGQMALHALEFGDFTT